MRVLIYTFNESGHVLPTFPLARALAACGHEVIYAAALDFRAEIESRGFTCVPMHPAVHPLGTATELERLPPEQRPDAVGENWARIAHGELMPNWFERQLAEINPDVALVDVIPFPVSFALHRHGVPILRMSTSLSQQLDELAPITTALTPDTPHLEREVSRLAAHAQMAAMRSHSVQIVSTRFGYPLDDVSFAASFAPFMRAYREVVLCPSAFDFPRQRAERPTYFAFGPEVDRTEQVPDVLREFCERDGPLIFVSLGTQSGRYPQAVALFRALRETLEARPDWRAVVASGDKLAEHESLAAPPANLLVLPRVPQIWLLGRATLFVTHAGLGSIREAIALRVPMLAVPQDFDQPGNAARIAWHEIGTSLYARQVTPRALENLIAGMLRERDAYLDRLATLDDACRAEITSCDAVAIVEQTAAERRVVPPPTRWLPTPPAVTPGGQQLAWLFVRSDGSIPRGGVLRPGETLDSLPGIVPEHGVAGFSAYDKLGDALVAASGPLLARVEIAATSASGPAFVGSSLRCLWLFDATRVLWEYTDWCTERGLEGERRRDPVLLAAYLADLRCYRAAARPDDLQRARESLETYLRYWYRGYAALTKAHMARSAHAAARFARFEMLQLVARGTSNDVADYEERYRAAIDDADAKLDREVAVATSAHEPAAQRAGHEP